MAALLEPKPAQFTSVAQLISATRPTEPVYCIYPHVLQAAARRFLEDFPGRVLYAVKANPDPNILKLLVETGVRHFDTASVPEIRLVQRHCPGATCYFMAPVRLNGAAGEACVRLGVRHFVVDHRDELDKLLAETRAHRITVFARMLARHPDATYDFSAKFGADRDETIALLRAVQAAGAVPALAFNVGSLIRNAGAHAGTLESCAEVVEQSGADIRLLDIGGGFPTAYPGLQVDPLERFHAAIRLIRDAHPLLARAELLCEPGRALVADGMSVLAQVLLRKPDSLYLNDGIWGSFIEPFVSHGLVRYPTRVYRGTDEIAGESRPFTLYGPTCDSLDQFPAKFPLPDAVRTGDWIEFGMMGAYSLSNRTHFNGFYPDTFVVITDTAALPPKG